MGTEPGHRAARRWLRAFGPAALGLVAGLAVIGIMAAQMGGGAGGPEVPRLGISAEEATRRAEVLAAGAPPAQAAAFADEQITLDEYRAAMVAATECLRRALGDLVAARGLPPTTLKFAGPDVSSDEFELTYFYGYETETPGALPTLEVTAQAERECRSEHVTAIEEAYQTGRLADPQFIERVGDEFLNCARDAGLEVRDGETTGAVIVAALAIETPDGGPPNALLDCFKKYPSVNVLWS